MNPSHPSVTQKVAIITGASRGIGAAIAKRLGQEKYTVVVNYSSHADEAAKVVDEITTGGGQAMAVQADVSDSKAVHRLFEQALQTFGRLDVLINSAGIIPSQLPKLADTDDQTFDRLFAVNVKGTFNTLREAAKDLEAGGRIINFSSSVVGINAPGYSVYSATKAAVESLTKIMAQELCGKKITVNAVAPGPTDTAMFSEGKSQEQIDYLIKATPLERLGTVEDIANVVAFLVGPEGSWINGQIIRANGGIV